MALHIGDKAPDFTLYNTDKQAVTLSELKGKKVVLLFFPQAFTGVCTTELCSVRDSIGLYADLEADIYAISVDSLFTLAKFKALDGYNFTLLSDFNKEASQAYGAFFNEFVFGMKGVSRRAAFVVDREGIIRYAEVLEKAADLPDFGKVQAALAAIA